LRDENWDIVEEWLEDLTFTNWARQTDEVDVLKWENYFNLHPEHWEMGKMGRSLVLGIHFKPIPKEDEKSRASLSLMLNQLNKNEGRKPRVNANYRKFERKLWLVAASLTFFMLTSGALYWQFFYNPSIFLVTDFGQQLEVVLPEGSVVTLNSNSKLKYCKQEPRKVWLEGEAYFQIQKMPETGEDFEVITQDLSVIVLGTSFNVNTRNAETEVFLEEGKVLLDIDNPELEQIEMNPGDLIMYTKGSEKVQDKQQDASALETVSWKEGALIFRDRPLVDALFEIEDIYGIQFIIQTDEISHEKISGGVPIRDLQVTLNTLTEVYGIQMRASGKRYFITGRDR